MFVGHYGVAFAVKTERNRIPLWVLFIAVQFLDYIWATLVLLGIEKLRVIKGFTAGSMLDSYYHPYSHSLIAAILWSSVAVVGYNSLCSRLGYSYRKSTALIVGVAVFSHWILDLLAHPRDLPIIVQTGDTFVPRTPLSDRATAMGVWIFYTLFVIIAFLLENVRSRRKIDPL